MKEFVNDICVHLIEELVSPRDNTIIICIVIINLKTITHKYPQVAATYTYGVVSFTVNLLSL